jgi:hypothetical protein
MELTKDHLIKGQIIKAGTNIRIRESNKDIKFLGKTFTDYSTEYISEAIDFMLGYLTNKQVTSMKVKRTPSKKMLGYVSLDQKTVDTLNFTMNLGKNPKFNIDNALTHVKQILEDQMIISDSNTVSWEGINYSENTTDGLDSEAYRNSPWEKEAYGRTDEIINAWKNSKWYKIQEVNAKKALKLLGLDGFLDGIEDFEHSELEEIGNRYMSIVD